MQLLHGAVKLGLDWLPSLGKDELILIVGCDMEYSVKERIFFGSAMSDGIFLGLLASDTERHKILSTVTQTRIWAFDGEDSPEDAIMAFRNANPISIKHAIESAIKLAKIDLLDVSYIVPHTPYNAIWDTLSELLGFPRNKILTNYLFETGHINSNDSFIHYLRAFNEGIISEGDISVLINPGFGGTRGCTIIQS